MAIPAGISTALVHLDAPVSFIGEAGRIHATITPSIPLVWAATGTPIGNFIDNVSLDPGVALELNLPHVNQAGFLDGSGNTVTGWSYRIDITYEKDGQNIPFPSRDFQILVGQTEVDLALVPSGTAYVPVVAPILTVTSLNGRTGAVTITKSDVGLANADNTSDAAKPVSTATQAALDTKARIWRPSTAYLVGDVVVSPKGELVKAKSTFSSGTVFDPSLWASVSLGEAVALRTNLATNPSFETASGTVNVRTNHATNPAFELTSGTINVRTNLATDPRATSLTVPNNGAGWRNTRWFGGGGGNGNYTLVTGATDSPVGTTYMRKTWNAACTGNGDTGYEHGQSGTLGLPVTAGTTYTFSSYLRSSAAGKTSVGISAIWYNSSGGLISATAGTTVSLTAATWTRLSHTVAAPTGAAFVLIISDVDGGTTWAIGDYLDGTGLLIEASASLGTYFDGATPITNLVTNPSFETDLTGWSTEANTSAVRETTDFYSGTASAKVTKNAATTSSTGFYTSKATVVGTTYTLSAYVKSVSGTPTVGWTNQNVAGTSVVTSGSWQRVSLTFTAVATTTNMYLTMTTTGAIGDAYLIDAVLLEASPTVNTYYEGQGDFTYVWSGTANASTSYQQAPKPTGLTYENGVLFYRDSTSKMSGTYSGKMMANPGDVYGVVATTVAGESWTFSMDYRTEGTLTGTPRITLQGGGSAVSYNLPLTQTTTTRVSVTLPATATGVTQVLFGIFGAVTGNYWIDNLMVEKSGIALPYFDGATPITNLVTNPSFETDTTGWTGNTGSPTLTASTDRSYIGSKSLKAVSTTASADIAAYVTATLAPNTTYTMSYYVYSADARTSYFDVAATNLNLSNVGSKAIPANTWTRVSATFTTTPSVTGAATFYLHNGGGPAVTGSIVYIDAVLLEKTDVLSPVFYEGQGDFTYVWSGTANASTSIQRGTGLTEVSTTTYQAVGVQSSSWSTKVGTKSLRVIPSFGAGQDSFVDYPNPGSFFSVGKTYTVSATFYQFAPQTGTLDTRARNIRLNDNGVNYIAQATNVAGAQRLSVTFTVVAGINFLRLYNGASVGNGDVWWDDLLIEESSTLGTYFDGSTTDTSTIDYQWTGTANASTSIAASTSTALQPYITPGTVAQFYRGDKTFAVPVKADVGLGNVDNTSDVNKPVSTATQTALNLKANLASPAFTGTPTGITATHVGLGNVNNTSDAAKPVSTATQAALDGKAPTVHVHSAADLTSGTLPDARLPARFGINPAVITDWNTVNQTGWYMGSSAANAPGTGWYMGMVEAHNNLWVTQTVHNFTVDSSTNTDSWRRSGNDVSGAISWGAWYKLQLSQAEQDARYQALIAAGTTAQYYRGDKTWQTLDKAAVGLGNVDNTSDANKPVSTAQATADDARAKGMVLRTQVTGTSGSVTDAIINNIPTFTFKANRNYRIVWDFSRYATGNSDSLFYCTINTAPVADAAASTANLTAIEGRTIGMLTAYATGSTQYTGPISVNYSPGAADVTTQIKFRVVRVLGDDGLYVVGNTNERAHYLIIDDGNAVL